MDYSQFAPDAVRFPNEFPSIGQSLMYEQQRQDEQNRWMYEQKQKQDAENRQNQYRMSQYMQDYLKPLGETSGIGQIDGYFNQHLTDLMNQMSSGMKNYTDLGDFEADLQRKSADLFSLHAKVQQDYKNNKAYVDELAKSSPDLAIGQVNNAMSKGLLMNTIQQKPDGSYDLIRNPDDYKPYDFVSQMSDPVFASQFVSSKKGLTDIMSKVPGQDVNAGTSWGNGNETNYKANLRSWEEPNFNTDHTGYFTKGNVIPSTRVKSNTVYIDGKPVQVISPDAQSTILGSDIAQRALYSQMFNETGMTPQQYSQLSPDQQNLIRGQYLYNIANANKKNFNATGDQRQPGAPKITVNTGQTTPNINDVYSDITDKMSNSPHGAIPLSDLNAQTQQEVLKYANSISSKGQDFNGTRVPLTNADVAIIKGGDGTLKLVKASNGKYSNKLEDVIAPLDFNSINLPANTGKAKQQVLKTAPSNRIKVDY